MPLSTKLPVIVARFFDLDVGDIEIGIGGDDAKGKSDISASQHLPLRDRVAICAAGLEAQNLFNCPTYELAGLTDFAMFHELLEDELSVEGERDAC